MDKYLFSWSGGKDSALALYDVLQEHKIEIAGLLTIIGEDTGRISMHGVRRSLLRLQAHSIGIPLIEVNLPENCSMEQYRMIMKRMLDEQMARGIGGVVFGDIFLEDIRDYREKQLGELGLHTLFPLWGIPTTKVARRYIDTGFRSVVTCVNGKLLHESCVGAEYDDSFLANLPDSVDPCGENGEFHTFAYDGPVFDRPIPFSKGKSVKKVYPSEKHDTGFEFYFIDLQ